MSDNAMLGYVIHFADSGRKGRLVAPELVEEILAEAARHVARKEIRAYRVANPEPHRIPCEVISVETRSDGWSATFEAHDQPVPGVTLSLPAIALGCTMRHNGDWKRADGYAMDPLTEAIILGDGGARHERTVSYLIAAGARRDIGDRNGVISIEMARYRGNSAKVRILESR